MAGSPPRWEPPVVDIKLKADKREAFRELNAARWPSYPLEPTIRSVHLMCPDIDLTSVDIIGCSHTISKLLDIVRGQSQKFRFDADVIGNTVLFIRMLPQQKRSRCKDMDFASQRHTPNGMQRCKIRCHISDQSTILLVG